MEKVLFIDIGNSTIKWKKSDEKEIHYLENEDLEVFISKNFDYEYKVYVSSVNPRVGDLIKQKFANKLVHFFKTKELKSFWKGTDWFSDMGVDIALSLIFGQNFFNKSKRFAVFNFGSCYVSSAVDENEVIGVSISPSFSAGLKYLKSNNNKFPTPEVIDAKCDLGLTNDQAWSSGLFHLQNGYLNSVVGTICKKHKIKDYLISGNAWYDRNDPNYISDIVIKAMEWIYWNESFIKPI